VTERLPSVARLVLEDAQYCYLAIRTMRGPHLTPVVFAISSGRLWMTTSRSSVKARAIAVDPGVAGLVRRGDVAVTFRGRVRTYDALDPLTWPAAAFRARDLTRAAARFTVKNLRFFAGYAVDAHRVPWSWTPPGRVFARIELTAGRVLDRGEVIDGWGEWGTGLASHPAFRALPSSRPIDLRAPRSVREAVGLPVAKGAGVVAFEAPQLTVLPARWRRVAAEGAYDVVLPRRDAELAEVEVADVPAALTVDHASEWRASGMSGLQLQGAGSVFDPARTRIGRRLLGARLEAAVGRLHGGVGEGVLVRLRPSRVVWWQGWSSGAAGA
jgi:hypothetical protein